MENVVQLEDVRRRRQMAQRPSAPTPSQNYQYFCLRCEAEEFRLFASGTIHCAKCGSLMRNIEVGSPNPQAAG
jgi:ribosomal protein L37AE/L43A